MNGSSSGRITRGAVRHQHPFDRLQWHSGSGPGRRIARRHLPGIGKTGLHPGCRLAVQHGHLVAGQMQVICRGGPDDTCAENDDLHGRDGLSGRSALLQPPCQGMRQIALRDGEWQPEVNEGVCSMAVKKLACGCKERPGWGAQGRHDDHVGGVWPVRHPLGADPGDPRIRREGPHRHLQQCRRGRCRAGAAAGDPANPQDDQLLCWRERNLCAAISGR